MSHDELAAIVTEWIRVTAEMNTALGELCNVVKSHERQLDTLNLELDQIGKMVMDQQDPYAEDEKPEWWEQ